MKRGYGFLIYFTIACSYLGAAAWVAMAEKPIDYPVYLLSAHGLVHQQNVYLWNEEDYRQAASELGIRRYTTPYRYSPVVAGLAIPLLFLPYVWGIFLWSLLTGAAIILTGELLARLSDEPRTRWLIRLSTWLFVPWWVVVYSGQANALAILPACAALLLLIRARESAGGFYLGLSLLIKPLAIGVLAYAAFKGRWRFVLTATAVLSLVLVPTVWIFGTASLHSLIEVVNVQPSEDSQGGYPPAQSFFGLSERWFTRHSFGWSVANDRNLALLVAASLSAVLMVVTVRRCWPPLASHTWSGLQLGLVVSGVLLVNSATWYHHYAMLVLPFSLMIGASRALRDLTIPALSWLLISAFGVAWHRLVGLTPLLDCATVGALVLWFCLLRRSPRPS